MLVTIFIRVVRNNDKDKSKSKISTRGYSVTHTANYHPKIAVGR